MNIPGQSQPDLQIDGGGIQWVIWGLVAPLIVYATRAVPLLVQQEIPFDSLHTYLPLAQQLLGNPLGFFSQPDSFKVAPGAVIYMALAGGTPTAVKAANLALALLAIFLMFDSARRLAGRGAAATAAWLFALSPMLLDAGITLMAESPFVFLVALWIWASTCAASTLPDNLAARWQSFATVLAGLALACATFTRATYIYWLPFGLVLFLALSRWSAGAQRQAALRIALLHLLALALVGAYIARQATVFHQPSMATGSGAAIYFGSNPMLSGYEPPYFGLTYDVVSVTKGLPHLSIEGDRLLMATAKQMLLKTPAPVLLEMYVQKIGAVLFFSRAHIDRHVVNGRAWRVALVFLACLGAWAGRRRPVVWMVAGATLYQCAVHVPVLYNPRYSIGALDILLVSLAAIGAAWLCNHPRRSHALTCGAGVIFIGIVFGAYHQRSSAPLMPALDRIAAPLVQRAASSSLQTAGWDSDPFAGIAQLRSEEGSIEWRGINSELDQFAVLHLALPHFQGECRQLRFTYTLSDGRSRSTLANLEGLKQGQDISWGMAALAMSGNAGRLTLVFQCTAGARMQFGEMALYDSTLGRIYPLSQNATETSP